jgi:hypothetical protein
MHEEENHDGLHRSHRIVNEVRVRLGSDFQAGKIDRGEEVGCQACESGSKAGEEGPQEIAAAGTLTAASQFRHASRSPPGGSISSICPLRGLSDAGRIAIGVLGARGLFWLRCRLCR